MRSLCILLLCAAMLCCAGCASPAAPIEEAAPAQAPSDGVPPSPAAPAAARQKLIGYIIEDDGEIATHMAMYGLLHMAENLGYPAKLYRATKGQEAEAAVALAAQDGCAGLLIQNPNGVNDKAVEAAAAAGIKVVVPYDACSLEALDANVLADQDEYTEEITRGIAARMKERSLKSGRILLYGANPGTAFAQFSAAVETYTPQYTAVMLAKTAADTETAAAELAEFLLYNRDIKGMYVMDADLAATAVQGRELAIKRFKSEGTPSPSPTAEVTPAPGETPSPTVAPGLLTQISITVFASGLNDENLELFHTNDIYALCIEPYYEASAQATMTLDRLLSGDTVARVSRVNRPIAYADTIDRYLTVYEQTKEMFGQ